MLNFPAGIMHGRRLRILAVSLLVWSQFAQPVTYAGSPWQIICDGLGALRQVHPRRYVRRLQSMPTPQVSAPLSSAEQASLYARAMADMERAAAAKDGLAMGSLPHIAEHQWLSQEFRDDIIRLGIDPEYYRTLATVHDMGKFLPDPSVLQLADMWQNSGRGNSFLTGRIAWHDQSTERYLLRTGESLGLSRHGTDGLIADIFGHNDGSALPDVFWNRVAWPRDRMGPYGLPKRVEGDVLTFFDRYGQGNAVGAEKIGRQLSMNQPFCSATVTEAYINNPTNTMRQLAVIADRISERGTVRVGSSVNFQDFDAYQAAVKAQQDTISAASRVTWEGGTARVVGADGVVHQADDWTQFFSPDFQQSMWSR